MGTLNEALLKSATRLKDNRKNLAALTAARRALAIEASAEAHGTLGAIQWNNDDFSGAIRSLRRSLATEPHNATDWAHLGLAQSSLGRWDDAEASYERALAINPDNVAVRWNRANFRLAAGRWDSGFEDYESRIAFRGPPHYPRWKYPTWTGEELNDKTIVVFAEQGVGDTILSSRYVWHLKQVYPRVRIIWFVQPRLHDLFWEFRDFVEFWPPGHPWPDADYAIFQMSLLRAFKARPDTIIADPGLILKRAKKGKDSIRIPESAPMKIGIAWTGNPDMLANEQRSIPLELILSLAENPKIQLYSLQVGDGADHLRFVDCADLVRDCSPELTTFGFAGAASLMLNLDLVLTVCTATAHLAGALGVPCWTMLSYDPYWVWLRESSVTPWYPQMKLFRQPKPLDWESVVSDVKQQLRRAAA